MQRVLLAVFFGFSAAACATSEANEAPRTADVGPTDPPAEETSAPGATPPMIPESPPSREGGSSSSGTVPPAIDRRILPLDVGRVWTWKGVETIQGDTKSITQTMRVERTTTVRGRAAFDVLSTAGPSTTRVAFVLTGDDDVESEVAGGRWIPTVKGPIARDATWTYEYAGTRSQTWSEAGKQYTDAGTFEDCWRVDVFVRPSMKPGDINFQVYCRGVGLVKTVQRIDGSTYGIDVELSSKSF